MQGEPRGPAEQGGPPGIRAVRGDGVCPGARVGTRRHDPAAHVHAWANPFGDWIDSARADKAKAKPTKRKESKRKGGKRKDRG